MTEQDPNAFSIGRRPRRLRRTAALRGLVRETRVHAEQLVQPVFVVEGEDRSESIEAMPGVARLSVDRAIELMRRGMDAGVRAYAVFPVIEAALKTADADEGVRSGNLVCRAVERMKRLLPEACVITDIALDPYSSLGHDGLVRDGAVANDETIAVLARMAVLHAEAGADVVAPSDMMDGRVRAIRGALDAAGREEVAILSYSAKYASAFYGPFREALDSAPAASAGVPGDKTTYQMDPANRREALVEAALDASEHADIVMVKPALAYLDVIASVRSRTELPVAAYQVSGEYAMLAAAGERGWLDRDAALGESLVGIVRAGADIVLTYAAIEWAERMG